MPRVLLVEDNEMNWDMLSRRLARREFSYTGFANLCNSQQPLTAHS